MRIVVMKNENFLDLAEIFIMRDQVYMSLWWLSLKIS